MAFYVLMCH